MKITKTRLQQIIKEEIEVLSEAIDIDSDSFYSMSGEDIIEMRKTLNNLENPSGDPERAAQELSTSIKLMRTLLARVGGPLR